jgi:hypothetical protein
MDRYGNDAVITYVWLAVGRFEIIISSSERHRQTTRTGADGKECKIRKLVTMTVVFVLAGLSASCARGGMHGLGEQRLMAPRIQPCHLR